MTADLEERDWVLIQIGLRAGAKPFDWFDIPNVFLGEDTPADVLSSGTIEDLRRVYDAASHG